MRTLTSLGWKLLMYHDLAPKRYGICRSSLADFRQSGWGCRQACAHPLAIRHTALLHQSHPKIDCSQSLFLWPLITAVANHLWLHFARRKAPPRIGWPQGSASEACPPVSHALRRGAPSYTAEQGKDTLPMPCCVLNVLALQALDQHLSMLLAADALKSFQILTCRMAESLIECSCSSVQVFRMSHSWSVSSAPGYRGCPVCISTSMQPAIHPVFTGLCRQTKHLLKRP